MACKGPPFQLLLNALFRARHLLVYLRAGGGSWIKDWPPAPPSQVLRQIRGALPRHVGTNVRARALEMAHAWVPTHLLSWLQPSAPRVCNSVGDL